MTRGMNKEEAIEVLDDMKVKINIPHAAVMQHKRNEALDMAISALKGGWIPVSERLPESGKEVLFCDIDDDIRLGYHIEDCPRTHFTEYGSWECMKNVVAWQPLPEPYKKGE